MNIHTKMEILSLGMRWSSINICLKSYVQLYVTPLKDCDESKALIWWLFGLFAVLKRAYFYV